MYLCVQVSGSSRPPRPKWSGDNFPGLPSQKENFRFSCVSACIFMHMQSFACMWMHMHAYAYICLHLHTYACIYNT